MNVSDESTIFNLALYLYHATERRKTYLQFAIKSNKIN